MVTYISDQFHYNRTTDTLSAEVSDLGCRAGEGHDGAIFSDAIDIGLAIRSVRSGLLAVYALKTTERNDDEIQSWEYEPVQRTHSMMCSPGELAPWDSYRHTKVVIYND